MITIVGQAPSSRLHKPWTWVAKCELPYLTTPGRSTSACKMASRTTRTIVYAQRCRAVKAACSRHLVPSVSTHKSTVSSFSARHVTQATRSMSRASTSVVNILLQQVRTSYNIHTPHQTWLSGPSTVSHAHVSSANLGPKTTLSNFSMPLHALPPCILIKFFTSALLHKKSRGPATECCLLRLRFGRCPVWHHQA